MIETVDWSTIIGAAKNTPDALAMQLQRMVLNNELREGDRLPPEREFAAQLGVSRTTLREALRVLELRGLLERKQGRGTVIRAVSDSQHALAIASGLDVDAQDLLNVMEVRACVEPPVAALAAERATPPDVERLRQLVVEMSGDLTPQKFAELDRLFHRTIAQITHNPLLLRLLDRVAEIVEVSRREHLLSRSRQKSSLAEHIAIYEAIVSRDGAAAHIAAHNHIRSIQARLTANADPDGGRRQR